jgi:ribosomal protein L37AE/L43A
LYDDQRQSYFVGCPECKKKVMPERQGYFRCENCNKTIPEHDARVTITLAAKFNDCTDGMFVQLIGEQAD